MSGQQIAMVAALGLALILPVAALRARSIPFGRAWKMAAIWAALFALVAIVFGRIGL